MLKRLTLFLILLLPCSAFSQGPQGGTIGGGGVPWPSTSAQGPRFNVKAYGAVADTQHVIDGVTAGGSGHTVTSATAAFAADVVGKKIVCAAGGNATPLMPISTITVRNSATQVTVSGAGDNGAASGLRCIWYTADDTTAWQSATNAAGPAIASVDPNAGKTLGTPPGTVYCPEGGYAVSGRIFNFVGLGNSIGPSLMGDPGKNHCIVYMIPGITDPGDGFAVLISYYNGTGFDMENITIDGLGFSSPFTHPIVGIAAAQQFTVKRVKITNTSANGGAIGTFDFNASSNGSLEDVFIQGAGNPANDFACAFRVGSDAILVRNTFCSNHNQNMLVDGNSATPRSVFGTNGITLLGSGVDECDGGTLNCAVISNGGLLNMHDSVLMQGSSATNYALSVDGTSRAYLSNVSCGVYGSISTTSNCMTIASGGEVDATMSDLRGNGAAGVAVNGTAGAKFYDLGGNKYRNSNNGVITDLTVANMFTNGFSGGVFPVFPLAIGSTTQLGMRQFVQGTAPTFAVTGFGTGPTVAVQTGSVDAAGAAIITAGTTPAATGTFTLTFSTPAGAYGTNKPVCTFTLIDGTGAWNALAQEPRAVDASTSTTSVLANWSNNAVALTAASTYGFNWSCYGK